MKKMYKQHFNTWRTLPLFIEWPAPPEAYQDNWIIALTPTQSICMYYTVCWQWQRCKCVQSPLSILPKDISIRFVSLLTTYVWVSPKLIIFYFSQYLWNTNTLLINLLKTVFSLWVHTSSLSQPPSCSVARSRCVMRSLKAALRTRFGSLWARAQLTSAAMSYTHSQ